MLIAEADKAEADFNYYNVILGAIHDTGCRHYFAELVIQ